jgi:hypothetical protein
MNWLNCGLEACCQKQENFSKSFAAHQFSYFKAWWPVFAAVKWHRPEANQSSQTDTEVRNAWSVTSTPLLPSCRITELIVGTSLPSPMTLQQIKFITSRMHHFKLQYTGCSTQDVPNFRVFFMSPYRVLHRHMPTWFSLSLSVAWHLQLAVTLQLRTPWKHKKHQNYSFRRFKTWRQMTVCGQLSAQLPHPRRIRPH